jgi:hypothetical protein
MKISFYWKKAKPEEIRNPIADSSKASASQHRQR